MDFNKFITDQESFWAGEFGDNYIERNKGAGKISSNIAFFSKIVSKTKEVESILEFGANIGLNLIVLKYLLPSCSLTGIEINKKAVSELKKWGGAEVVHGSILDVELDKKFDLTLSKGVLIHINPDFLNNVYRGLYEYSQKYICIAEYYNPTPVSVSYRGNDERLFKRDFAGEMMDTYPNLKLVDYGFAYHRDPVFPQDDINWFLLEKK
ncbi:pseudaminic acid biosynthesis-associated methylase [Thermodesulfobacteriota bacterium]